MRKVNDKSVDRMISIIFRECWVEVRWRTEVSITIIKIEAWINMRSPNDRRRPTQTANAPARRSAIDALQSLAN